MKGQDHQEIQWGKKSSVNILKCHLPIAWVYTSSGSLHLSKLWAVTLLRSEIWGWELFFFFCYINFCTWIVFIRSLYEFCRFFPKANFFKTGGKKCSSVLLVTVCRMISLFVLPFHKFFVLYLLLYSLVKLFLSSGSLHKWWH